MSKRFWAVIIVALLVVIGIVWVSSDKSANAPGSNQPTNHVEGQGKKNVTLIEYGDYECPICGSYHPIITQVVDKYKNDIHFQFRNLPLTQIHQNAFAAARAAEAAGLQNKFWQMHDLLYNNQQTWSTSSSAQAYFEQYAQTLGLNLAQFKSDYASTKVNNLINADLKAFAKTGQEQATPTFFLDGKYIKTTDLVDTATGQPSLDKFSQLLDKEIAKKNPAKTDTTNKR